MKRICATFPNSGRFYTYQTELNLIEGGMYEIECSGGVTYTSPVMIHPQRENGYNGPVKTIVSAKLVQAPPRRENKFSKVIFNLSKETTTVLWTDGTKTTVRCGFDDEFDEEKGVLACYMKRAYGNRGYYNEYVREAIENAEYME